MVVGYRASKTAPYSATQATRIERAARGIRLHAVNPRPVDTPMAEKLGMETTNPADTAEGMLGGIENSEADVLPDAASQQMLAVRQIQPPEPSLRGREGGDRLMQQMNRAARSEFPVVIAKDLDGRSVALCDNSPTAHWKMIAVLRGQHCSLRTRYLNCPQSIGGPLAAIGIEIVAVSGDSDEQLKSHLEKLDVSFPVYHSLGLDQMRDLGLYISRPRSPAGSGHPFLEPQLFIINAKNRIQVIDIEDDPFSRPDPDVLLSGVQWIKSPRNDDPICGTWEP